MGPRDGENPPYNRGFRQHTIGITLKAHVLFMERTQDLSVLSCGKKLLVQFISWHN